MFHVYTFDIAERWAGVPYLYRVWIIRLPSCFMLMSTNFPVSSVINFNTNRSRSSFLMSTSRRRFQISFAYHQPEFERVTLNTSSPSGFLIFRSKRSLFCSSFASLPVSSFCSFTYRWNTKTTFTWEWRKGHLSPFVHLLPNLHSTIIYFSRNV